ncbi:MAG: thioredoxin family protein [Planctomycetota bacterium]
MRYRSVVAAVLTLASSAIALAEPGVFSKRGLQNDRALAKARDRLHIVYATAAWCGPCQRMKRETWVNPLVEEWIGEHAVMTAVDIDEHPKFREQNGIRGIPALILMDGKTEVARFSGYKTAAETLSWLERNRRRAEDRSKSIAGDSRSAQRRSAAHQRTAVRMSPMKRWEQANMLIEAGRVDSATRLIVSLWGDATDERDAETDRVRSVFVRSSAQRLTSEHEPAREAFAEIRDRNLERLHAGEQDPRLLEEWIMLNGMLGGQRLTMGWVDVVLGHAQAAEVLSPHAAEVAEQALVAERWDVVAACVPDPAGAIEREWRMMLTSAGALAQIHGVHPFDAPELLEPMLLRPIVAALHAGDGGASERRLIAVLESKMGDEHAWRAVFVDAARRTGALRDEHRSWVEAFELDTRFAAGADADANATAANGGARSDWSAEWMRNELDRAMTLRHEGDYAGATDAIIGLWDCPVDLIDDEMHQVRGLAAFVSQGIADEHVPSRRRFFELRGRLIEAARSEDVTLYEVHDWLRLNEVIRDPRQSMFVYDELKAEPESDQVITFAARTLVAQAFSVERWDVLAEIIDDPAAEARIVFDVSASSLESGARELGSHPYDAPGWIRGMAEMQIVAALHKDDGGQAERRLIEVLEDETNGRQAWRLAFIETASHCGKLRRDHVRWITEHGLHETHADDPVVMQLAAQALRQP